MSRVRDPSPAQTGEFMSDEEKQSATVFVEGAPICEDTQSVRVASPYEKDALRAFSEARDTSVTRQKERDHRLECLKMATGLVGTRATSKEDPYCVVKFAKRFWEFVQEGK